MNAEAVSEIMRTIDAVDASTAGAATGVEMPAKLQLVKQWAIGRLAGLIDRRAALAQELCHTPMRRMGS